MKRATLCPLTALSTSCAAHPVLAQRALGSGADASEWEMGLGCAVWGSHIPFPLAVKTND